MLLWVLFSSKALTAAHAHRGNGMWRLASAIQDSSHAAMFCNSSSLADVALAVPLVATPFDHVSARHVHEARNWTSSVTREVPCGALAQLTSPSSQQPSTNVEDGWRLLRTPDPRGGRDSIAVSRTADLLRSDPEFAGMMLRCTGGEIETPLCAGATPVAPQSSASYPQFRRQKPTVRSGGGAAWRIDPVAARGCRARGRGLALSERAFGSHR
jgi:hypothetical protein